MKMAIFIIIISWLNSKVNTITIKLSKIENLVSKMFSLFAKFYVKISTNMAPKPSIKTLMSKIPKH